MRKRNENGYRNTSSKNDEFSARFNPEISNRIRAYCEKHNLNKTRFCEDCVIEVLNKLEREDYNSMSKDMLIEILMSGK